MIQRSCAPLDRFSRGSTPNSQHSASQHHSWLGGGGASSRRALHRLIVSGVHYSQLRCRAAAFEDLRRVPTLATQSAVPGCNTRRVVIVQHAAMHLSTSSLPHACCCKQQRWSASASPPREGCGIRRSRGGHINSSGSGRCKQKRRRREDQGHRGAGAARHARRPAAVGSGHGLGLAAGYDGARSSGS